MRFRLIPSRFSITWKRFFSSSGGAGSVDTRKAGMDRATIHPPNKLRLADANWAGTLWINLGTTKIAIYSNRCTVLPSKISAASQVDTRNCHDTEMYRDSYLFSKSFVKKFVGNRRSGKFFWKDLERRNWIVLNCSVSLFALIIMMMWFWGIF